RETLTLLMEVPAAYRTQINEVLLTALARTLGQWTGASSVLLDLEGHGREEIFAGVDLSRTVGWFTTIFPVALDLKESQTPIDAVTSGELRLEWTYSESIHRRETVERLAQSYIEELQTLIAQARSRVDAASFSPADFPRAKLSPQELNKVLAKLTGSQGEGEK